MQYNITQSFNHFDQRSMYDVDPYREVIRDVVKVEKISFSVCM